MNSARILLTTPIRGYLDIKPGSDFPINLGVGDIRDISKRQGGFSRTLTVVGNDNNNNLLGHLYDINVDNSSINNIFDVNVLQECLIEQDGVVIKDNLYFQLTSVKKVQRSENYDYDVEYECEVKDSTGDFFNKIANLELDDLDFDEFNNHTYTAPNIINTFGNTYVDGYKYILPWKQTGDWSNNNNKTYDLKEFKIGIYARQYWDKIFYNAGYTYTFEEKDDIDIQFDKLIIPYNGEDVKVEDNPEFIVEAERTTNFEHTVVTGNALQINYYPYVYNYTGVNPNGVNAPTQIIIDTEISDDSNQYNPTTGEFQPAFEVSPPGVCEIEFTVEYEVDITTSEDITLTSVDISTSGTNIIKPGMIIRNNDTNAQYPFYFDTHEIMYGTTFSAGTTNIITGSSSYISSVTSLLTTTILTNEVYLSVQNTGPQSALSTWPNGPFGGVVYAPLAIAWKNSSGDIVYPEYTMRVTNIHMNIVPKNLALEYNSPIVVNSFIPKKIKQLDFIKSICTMYNLFIEVDPDDVTNLIIKTRDNFYDTGVVNDWTYKIAKGQEQLVKFLPELLKKKLILTYKQDKDAFNTQYYNYVNEIYGQIDYTFENEYVRDVDTKELIFSPTPMMNTDFGANTPAIDGFTPKNNIRILLDNGIKSCGEYYIEDITNHTVTEYPFISHFSDNPNTPNFDINFGVCDFYYYNDYEVTNNNLYNAHWRRTLGQINNGKMLTASFDLNAVDIQKLKLNDKIRIDNSYWYINKVIDYNANTDSLTRVELISVDDEFVIPPFKTRITRKPNSGGLIYLQPDLVGPVGGGPGNEPGDGSGGGPGPGPIKPQKKNIILSPVANVYGNNNYINKSVHGDINGDNNWVFGEKSNVTGNNNTVMSSADVFGNHNIVDYACENIIINGDNNIIEPGVFNVTVNGSGMTITVEQSGGVISDRFHTGDLIMNNDSIQYTGITGATGVTASGIYFGHDEITGETIINIDSDYIYINGTVSFTMSCDCTLEEVLTNGNETGVGNDIIMSTGSALTGNNINLEATNSISNVATNNFNAFAFNNINLECEGQMFINAVNSFQIGDYNNYVDAFKMVFDGATNSTTDDDKGNSILSSRNSSIDAGVVNTSVIGGDSITATMSNTAYVDNLNISTVNGGVIIKLLGIDDVGNVRSTDNIIELTLSELTTLKNNEELIPGMLYHATDVRAYFLAITENQFDINVIKIYRGIKNEYYSPFVDSGFLDTHYTGIYGQAIAAGAYPVSNPIGGGDVYYAIWGGRMWQRKTSGSDVAPSSSINLNSTGWDMVTTTDDNFYYDVITNIKYNFDDGYITSIYDDKNNLFNILSNAVDVYDDVYNDWGNAYIFNNTITYNVFSNAYFIINNFQNSSGYAIIQSNDISGPINNNSNNGDIYSNSNNGAIYDNSNNSSIDRNSNDGNIDNNSNIGRINSNFCGGVISNNSNVGAISNNSNSLYISDNSNVGDILFNSNTSYISNNANSGDVNNNSNIGFIHQNSNVGDIINNSNVGNINVNYIIGSIYNNINIGNIQDNTSNVGTTFHIYNNMNNGEISFNNSTANISIFSNMNNGYIGTTSTTNRAASISDAIVNK